MSKPSISIIITNYRTPDKLEKCLRLILSHHLDDDFRFWEIIVADSGTIAEEKKKIVSAFPQITFLESKENIGYSRGVNRALKIAQGENILVINSDIFITGDIFSGMVKFLEENKDVGIVAPRLENVDGGHQYSAFRFYNLWIILARRTFLGKTKMGKKIIDRFTMKKEVAQSIRENKPLDVDWLMGSAFLFRKKLIGQIGYFDERFFMYFEDVDWCRRIKRAGYRVVYLPNYQIIHYHLQASCKSGGIREILTNKYTRIHISSWLKYCWKWKSIF